MKVVFQTNLDAPRADVRNLNDRVRDMVAPSVPRIGDSVVFPFTRNNDPNFSFDLRVTDVTYNYFAGRIEVELHLPPGRTIAEWTPWFKKFRYGRDD